MATVFISYSHKDEPWKNQLATHLKSLEIEGFYQAWDDTLITPGSDWRMEIETALNRARVAVMLISADYLASRFINEVEVPLLLKRRRGEKIRGQVRGRIPDFSHAETQRTRRRNRPLRLRVSA